MNEVYLFLLECEPPARVWSGNGDLFIGPCPFDPVGGTYQGAGLAELPAVQQLINGVAERIELAIGGLTSDGLRLAHEDRESVHRARCKIGSQALDDKFQQIGTVKQEWKGTADTITISSEQSESGRVRTVKLSIGSDDTGRSRPKFAFFTDADQKRRSPDDDIFNQVAKITNGITRRFGPR